MTRFKVLGPLELNLGGETLVPRGPMVRKIIALLLVRANHLVDTETLVEELWDGDAPRTAMTTLRTHVYHIRKMVHRTDGESGTEVALVTQPGGYQLRIAEDDADVTVFEKLVSDGRRSLREQRPEEAVHTLCRALELWRGPALANVDVGPVLSRHLVQLDELHHRAIELRIDAHLQSGQHRDLVAELRGLVAANPLNEWFQARLIDVLHRSGRRHEALEAIHELRSTLKDELGLEPSSEVQRLQYEILSSRPAGRS